MIDPTQQAPQEGPPVEQTQQAPQEGPPVGQQGGGGIVSTVQAEAEGNVESLPPEVEQELRAYKTLLNKVIHSKDTQKEVMGMLESGDLELAVPMAALQIDKMAAEATGGKVSTGVRLGGGVYIVTELIELGMAANYWPQPTEEEAQLAFQDTLQDYIEAGLKDGSIDPIELQEQTEPLLNEEQTATGMQMGQEFKIPNQGNPHQAVYNAQGLEKRQAPPPPPQGAPVPQQGGVL